MSSTRKHGFLPPVILVSLTSRGERKVSIRQNNDFVGTSQLVQDLRMFPHIGTCHVSHCLVCLAEAPYGLREICTYSLNNLNYSWL